MSVNTKMTAIADEIRELSGTTGTMGLDAMATHVGEANTEVDSQTELLAQAVAALEGKASGGEQAAPVISVSSNGLITATAGSKSTTHQLAFQAAKTITPSTASQIAVSSGYYTGGNVMVAGDANLVAGNIKSGVSIFGVSGTLTEGGSGEAAEWSENEDAIVSGTISSYTNDRVTTIRGHAFYNYTKLTTISFPVATTIGNYAFYSCTNLTTTSFQNVTTIGNCAFSGCTKLTTISFPNVTTIGNSAFGKCYSLTTISFPVATTIGIYAFDNCSRLTTASFPVATTIGSYAFDNCSRLTTISFPVATTIGNYAFSGCTKLTTISFPVATTIGSYAFRSCYQLKSLYLTNSQVCTLSNSNAFYSTPIGGYSTSAGTYGSIYVPASLLTAYQTATNWTYFSSRFVGI